MLDERASGEALEQAAEQLYALLGDGRWDLSRGSTGLPSGLAISPADAASCTRDARRTAVFLRGVLGAIREARQRFPGERLNAVYAGTGPLATLVVPLLSLLSSDDIRFAFLDIHAEAIESVDEIVTRFGFEEFVLELRACDATTYCCDYPLHLAITETMQRALTVEPQVAVMRHFAAQLAPGGLLVPERIALHLGFADPSALSSLVPLGTIDDLATEMAFSLPILPPHYRGVGTADIVVFGRHRLAPFESGLTHPEVFFDLAPAAGGTVVFRYELGERPRLRWSLLHDRNQVVEDPERPDE